MVRISISVLVMILAVGGCDRKPAGDLTANPGATPAASPAATAGAAPTVSPTPITQKLVYTVDGTGPYVFGAKLADLLAAGLLDEMVYAPQCDDGAYGRGTGAYKDVRVAFAHGVLEDVNNFSADIPTEAGARIGNTMAQLQSIYGAKGKKLVREDNGDVAFLMTASSGRGIIFYFKDDKVSGMSAGSAEGLEGGFQYDIDC